MANAIEKIHEFNRFGSVLGLERMNVLLEKLGNPHLDLDVIHVAGTNGKGSVSKYLEEGLAACGYRMGLYTSPYIESFNERIRVGGEDISDDDLDIYTDRVLSAVDEMVAEGNDSPTEFEVVTAVAFLYFKKKQTDITILEVGLGGSGDSTNVVKSPMASVICSISYDHMDRLGNTLSEIAADKAGIIKSGCPVISNVAVREASTVIARTAYERGSRLYDVSKIRFEIFDETPFSQKVSMELYDKDYSDVEISMVGKHQGENLKTALATIEILRKSGKIRVERSKLYDGIKRAKQPGRFEVVRGGRLAGEWIEYANDGPMIILDGAHNEAGAAALQRTMKRYFDGKKILLCVAMLADKQVDEMLAHFTEITDDIVASEPDNPRRLAAEKLYEKLNLLETNVRLAENAEQCAELVNDIGREYDVVLFAGSLYYIGTVRRILRDE